MPDDHLLFEAAEVLAEYEAGHGFRTPVSVTSEQAYRAVAADIDRRSAGEVRGLPWPPEWPTLARRLGPLEPSSLTVVAARPSVGKTVFALQLARHLASEGKRVLFVSRELSVVRLMRRNLAAYGADMMRLRTGILADADHEAITNLGRDLSAWDLRYDDSSKSVEEMRREAEVLGPDVVIIDYLQRLAYDTEKEYAAITRIVNELQDLTLETTIPVVCLSQLARPVRGFEHKPPTMSDTRGSGAVEERAANLVLLHRDWLLEDEEHEGKRRTVARVQKDTGVFIIAKSADSETGAPIHVSFNGPRMRIEEKLR